MAPRKPSSQDENTESGARPQVKNPNADADRQRAQERARFSRPDRFDDSHSARSSSTFSTVTRDRPLAALQDPTAPKILQELEVALSAALTLPVEQARARLVKDWFPFVRRVLELSGGDGVDARVKRMLGVATTATTPLLDELRGTWSRLEASKDRRSLLANARGVAAVLMDAVEHPTSLSKRVLEEELENRISFDALLGIFFGSSASLRARALTLQSMGKKLTGLTSVAPLKVEQGLILAELQLRDLD